jgi:iron complex transport system substrate-binding protein
VSVRGAGDRPTVVESPPERVVALDRGSAELLAELGAGGRLVGMPAGVPTQTSPQAEEVVRRTGQVNVDAVVELRPDLIVATPSTDPVDVARAGRQSGATVYLQPALSLADVARGALELGFLLGEPTRARRLVGSIRGEIARVERLIAGTPSVSVFVDTGFFITVPARSLLGDLVSQAGGENVAGPTPPEEPFALCEVVELNPEVILVPVKGTGARAAPAYPFERCGEASFDVRVVPLPAELVTRAGPRVAEGLEAVARALHPDAFG